MSTPPLRQPALGERLLRHALSFLAALAPLLVLAYVLRQFVDFPFNDEWALPAIRDYFASRLSFGSFFELHNEHRLPLTNLLFLGNQLLMGGHRLPLVLLDLALEGAFLGVLALALRRSFPSNTLAWSAFVALASWLCFPLGAVEDWLWPFEVQFFLCQLFYLLAIFAFCFLRPTQPRLLASVALGLLATYSSANGLLVWPVLLAAAFAARSSDPALHPPLSRQELMFLALACLAGAGSYFLGYHRTHLAPPSSLLDKGAYLLAWLGAPFGLRVPGVAMAGGALGLAWLAAIGTLGYRRRAELERQALLPWLLALAYPLGSGALATLGRAGYGPEQALASRYILTSSLYWLFLAVLTALLSRGRPGRARAGGMLLAVALVSTCFACTGQLYAAERAKIYGVFRTAATMTRAGGYNPHLLAFVCPDFRDFFPDQDAYLDVQEMQRRHGLIPSSDSPLEAALGHPVSSAGYALAHAPSVPGAITEVFRFRVQDGTDGVPVPPVSEDFRARLFPAVEFQGWIADGAEEIVLLNERKIVRGFGHPFRSLSFPFSQDEEFPTWVAFADASTWRWPDRVEQLVPYAAFHGSRVLLPLTHPRQPGQTRPSGSRRP